MRHGRLDLAKLDAFAGAAIAAADAERWLAGLGFAHRPRPSDRSLADHRPLLALLTTSSRARSRRTRSIRRTSTKR